MTEIQFTNFLARNVENFSQQNGHLFSTKGRTLEKSNFHVTIVRNPLQSDVISKTTKEGILKKGLFLAIRVTKHFKPLLTCIITSGEQSKASGMLNVCEIMNCCHLPYIYVKPYKQARKLQDAQAQKLTSLKAQKLKNYNLTNLQAID